MTARGITGRCKAAECGAELLWAVSLTKGNGLPLDVDPVPDGNLLIDHYRDDGRPVVRNIAKGETVDPNTARYRAHFTSCTDPDKFRKDRKPS